MSASIQQPATGQAMQSQGTRKSLNFGLDNIMLILVTLYFVVPLITTLVFAVTDGSQFSMSGFANILNDADFGNTLLLSLELAVASMLLTVLVVTPTAYWVQLRLPRARVIMDILALVPFAVPAIVLAFGLIEVYSNENTLIDVLSLGIVPLLRNSLNIVDTPPLLICAYVIIALPFVYRPIDNNLRAINTRVLSEASSSLGAGLVAHFSDGNPAQYLARRDQRGPAHLLDRDGRVYTGQPVWTLYFPDLPECLDAEWRAQSSGADHFELPSHPALCTWDRTPGPRRQEWQWGSTREYGCGEIEKEKGTRDDFFGTRWHQ